MSQNRDPRGQPTGGQFAGKTNPESETLVLVDRELTPHKMGFEVGEMMMNAGRPVEEVRQYAAQTKAASTANLDSERFGASAKVNLEFARGIMAAAEAGEDAAWANSVAAHDGKSKAQSTAEEKAHPSGFMARSEPTPIPNRSSESPEPGPMT